MTNSATAIRRGGLSASQEDYIEAIHGLLARAPAVRASAIARRMGVTRPSVTGALRGLSQRGLVDYAPYGIVTLTPMGQRVAEAVTHRHQVLRRFFVEILGLGEQEAEQVACAVEHVVTGRVIRRIERLSHAFVGRRDEDPAP